jgi:glycosyltransferase involved in cell wall biosynthesis
LKIVHITDNSYPNVGGVERVVHELAKRQMALGHRVLVISQCEKLSNVKTQVLRTDGVTYLKIPKPIFPYLSKKYVEKLSPDIVHLNSYLAADSFSSSTAIPVLRHVHDVYDALSEKYFGLKIGLFAPALERKWVAGFHNYLVPSSSTLRKLSRIIQPFSKVWVVPNGVDTRVFRFRDDKLLRKKLGLRSDDKIVGFVGRIAIGKGAVDAYTVSAPFLREGNVYLVYIGPKDTVNTSGQRAAYSIIRSRAERDRLSKKVFFIPPLSDCDLAAAYSDMDVLLLPSTSEGFGLCVLEAAACGTPSIVYRAGSLPEIVSNGKTGIIVPQGDLEGMSCALGKILRGEFVKEKFMERCVNAAKIYDWETVALKVTKIYRELISNS